MVSYPKYEVQVTCIGHVAFLSLILEFLTGKRHEKYYILTNTG